MAKKKKLKGIGGWLLFLIICIWIGAILSISNSAVFLGKFYEFNDYYEQEFGENIPQEATHQLFSIASYSMFSLIYGVLLFFILFLAHTKKRKFINWAAFSLWFGVLSLIILSLLFPQDSILNLPVVVISAIIWTAYLKKSKRVKNTFVK